MNRTNIFLSLSLLALQATAQSEAGTAAYRWCNIAQTDKGTICVDIEKTHENPNISCAKDSVGKTIAGYHTLKDSVILSCVGPQTNLTQALSSANKVDPKSLPAEVLRPKQKYGWFIKDKDDSYKFKEAQSGQCDAKSIGTSAGAATCFRYSGEGMQILVLAKTKTENEKLNAANNVKFANDQVLIFKALEDERVAASKLKQQAIKDELAKGPIQVSAPKAPGTSAAGGGKGGEASLGGGKAVLGPSFGPGSGEPAKVTYNWRKLGIAGTTLAVIDFPIWGYEVPEGEACNASTAGTAHVGVYDEKEAAKKMVTTGPLRNSEIIYCLASNEPDMQKKYEDQKNLDLSKVKKVPLREERIYKWVAIDKEKAASAGSPGVCGKGEVGNTKVVVVPYNVGETIDEPEGKSVSFKCVRIIAKVKKGDTFVKGDKDSNYTVVADSQEALEKYEDVEDAEIERRIASLLEIK